MRTSIIAAALTVTIATPVAALECTWTHQNGKELKLIVFGEKGLLVNDVGGEGETSENLSKCDTRYDITSCLTSQWIETTEGLTAINTTYIVLPNQNQIIFSLSTATMSGDENAIGSFSFDAVCKE